MKSKATRSKHFLHVDTEIMRGQAYNAIVTDPVVTSSMTCYVYKFPLIDYATCRTWCYFIKLGDVAFIIIRNFHLELM